jgi:uncharacterized protein YihD (DUF1040 family)
MDRRIEEYVQEVQNEFVGKYSKQLDEMVLELTSEFGFKGDISDLKDWLKNENLAIMTQSSDNLKTIYLQDMKSNCVKALFFIEFKEDEYGLMYRFSDIIINEG